MTNVIQNIGFPRLRQSLAVAAYSALSAHPHLVVLAVSLYSFNFLLTKLVASNLEAGNPTVGIILLPMLMVNLMVIVVTAMTHKKWREKFAKMRANVLRRFLEGAGVMRQAAYDISKESGFRSAMAVMTGPTGLAIARGVKTPIDRLTVLRHLAKTTNEPDACYTWFANSDSYDVSQAMKSIGRSAVQLEDGRALPLVEALMEIERLSDSVTPDLIKTSVLVMKRGEDMANARREILRLEAEPALRERVRALRVSVMADGTGT